MPDEPRTETAQPNSGRLRRVAAAFLLGVVVATLFVALSASRSEEPANLTGDYPAFYGAGRIARDGDWHELYDVERQAAEQTQLRLAADAGAVRYMPYPPQVAAAYGAVAWLPYAWSWLVVTLVMAASLVAAVLISRPMVPRLRGREVEAVAVAVMFWPALRAVTGGTNTPFVLLLVVLAWRSWHDGHDGLAGLAVAALAFKPQIGLPFLALVVVRRKWRTVTVACAGLGLFYLAGVPLLGANWPAEWLRAARWLAPIDAEINGHSAINYLGFLENVLGVGAPVAVYVGWALALATGAAAAWVWHRNPDLAVAMAVAIPAIVLSAPHVRSHDGMLLLITLGVVWQRRPKAGLVAVAAVLVVASLQIWMRPLGFSTGFLVAVAGLAWALEEHWATVRRSRGVAVGP